MEQRATIFLGEVHPPHDQWYTSGLINGWPGDARYGWTTEALLTPQPLPPQPEDFASFWAETLRESDALPSTLSLTAELHPPDTLADSHRLLTGSYESLGGISIGCWILIPTTGAPARNLTYGHGYGGRIYPDLGAELIHPDDAVILPVLRGLPQLSLSDDIPAEAPAHVVHGIESPHSYVLRGCVADVWRATSELDLLVGEHPRRYTGASFGGGIGVFALLSGRYERAALHVPTFGNHPLRVTLPCIGSGAGVSRRVESHPETLDVLAYFDAAIADHHVTTPTMVSAALWDPAVVPPGQFAVHHALAGDKQLVVQDCGHTDYPGMEEQSRRWAECVRDWLR